MHLAVSGYVNLALGGEDWTMKYIYFLVSLKKNLFFRFDLIDEYWSAGGDQFSDIWYQYGAGGRREIPGQLFSN